MFRESQTIGPYTLIRKLGKGGFGEVWLAERKGKFVTTKVAVKLPLDEQVDHAAIEQEARLWEQASGHPNVLPIIEADEYDGQIVIISEYAPDGSLEQLLKTRGKLEIKQAVEMTVGILNGLEFLHSKNIIHRDLKPANILLQGTTPRLADFGISRAMRTTMTSQSQHISGTFAYMSPEALDGRRSIQTDIWSVGVNLYQFLTGSLPFPQKEFTQLLISIAGNEPEPLPDFVPPELKRIIAKSLEKLPQNRYKTTGEMYKDLYGFLQGNPEKTGKTPMYEVPPTESSPKIIDPVLSNLHSTVTELKVPIKTNDTKTNVSPLSLTPKSKKNRLYLGIRAIILSLILTFSFIIFLFTFGYLVDLGKSTQNYSDNSVSPDNNSANSNSGLSSKSSTLNANISNTAPQLSLIQEYQKLLKSSKTIKANFGGIAFENFSGEIVWSNAEQKGFMHLRNLPVNDKSKEQYQLWIVDAQQGAKTPVSGGVFDITETGEVIIPVDAEVRVSDPKAFAITVEKPGGVVVSKQEKVAGVAKV